MSNFTERTEMAHKFGIELQVARIDKIKLDNNQDIPIVKTMGQPCIVTNDLSEIAQQYNKDLRFYELARLTDYVKLITTGKFETTGIPMYWLGNTSNGIFTIKPKIHFFTTEQAFSSMLNNLNTRSEMVTESYARSVLNKADLIKTSLYLSDVAGYQEANAQFTKLLAQQRQKQK